MSTFNALTVESNVAVNANVNITTDVGALAIDADAENATTGLLTVAAGVTLTSAAGITLDATTQGITFTGAGTLNAVNGVTINDAVTATAGTLTIDADTDNDGTGTFTTIAAGTINSTGQTLDITAGDVSLAGAVSAATLINITDSDGNGIGLGDTALGAFQLSGTELQLLTATTLELATAGNVTVDNITATNSNNVTNLTIDAAGAITFATAKSTFNALNVEADGAVFANIDIETDVGALLIDADDDNNAGTGTGLLTVAAGVTLTSAAGITLDATTGGISFTAAGNLAAVNGVTINDAVAATAGTLTIDADTDNDGTGTFTTIAAGTINSTGQTLDITAGDVVIGGAVTAATLINITDSDGGGIGFGDTALGGFQLSGAELQLLTATTLELATAGNVTVDNISATNSNTVTNLTIDAVGAITFASVASTFNALNVESDAAVTANVDITTDVGALLIDADDDNNAGTGTGLLTVAANVTLTSAAGITLDATEGGITFTGAGTLNAVNGVTINDAVTATAGTLTIDADTDNDGTGTFTTIATGTINSAGQTLDITASDVVIGATIAAATLNITDSDGGGIGLGDTTVVGGLNVSAAELQRITTTTLMELITAGNVTVDNITAANSNTVNTLTIDAVGAITFANNASTFNALTVEADGAVTANANITTDVGALLIDADDDNNAVTGTGLLTVAANVTLTSAAGITLDATEGGITFTGAGTLNAVNGVTINDAVTATAGTLTIDADTDNDGTGTFTTIATGTINSTGQTLDITAGDVVIGGAVTAATLINITDSDGNGIGLGDTTVGGFQLSGTELQLLTATTLWS